MVGVIERVRKIRLNSRQPVSDVFILCRVGCADAHQPKHIGKQMNANQWSKCARGNNTLDLYANEYVVQNQCWNNARVAWLDIFYVGRSANRLLLRIIMKFANTIIAYHDRGNMKNRLTSTTLYKGRMEEGFFILRIQNWNVFCVCAVNEW